MGTVINLTTKESVTVEEDLDTVLKAIQEKQFIFVRKKHTTKTVVINRDIIALMVTSPD